MHNLYLFLLAEISNVPKVQQTCFSNCADILQSGVTEDGIYNICLPNSTQTVKVIKHYIYIYTIALKCCIFSAFY